ncbi:MAG: hypothetical protein EBU96_06045 [Actinobacteria bacterium]|nr:hypothetical protein [Actinomycetota bacterium]
MPNHITNLLTLQSGRNIREVLKPYISEKADDEGNFNINFDYVKRMPKSLAITAGGSVDTAIAVLKKDMAYFKDRLHWPWVKELGITTAEALYEHEKKKLSPKELNEGKKAIQNLKKYGHKDWYGWCIENWGTKWNSYWTNWSEDGSSVTFCTAWSPPEPILQKMADETGEVITNEWYDEGDSDNIITDHFTPDEENEAVEARRGMVKRAEALLEKQMKKMFKNTAVN